jgi:acid phosphatase family membrane protein YuiD
MLVLYDMVVDRKREEMLEQYYMKDASLLSEVKDGYILDLAGHTLREVLWGAVLGISIGIITVYFVL